MKPDTNQNVHEKHGTIKAGTLVPSTGEEKIVEKNQNTKWVKEK